MHYSKPMCVVGIAVMVATIVSTFFFGTGLCFIALTHGLTRTGLFALAGCAAAFCWSLVGIATLRRDWKEYHSTVVKPNEDNPYASPKGDDTPNPKVSALEERYQQCLRNVQRAWTLPTDYFEHTEVSRGFAKVWREVERDGKIEMDCQSPLHWCMDVGHSHTDNRLRERLVMDRDYQWAMRRVFRNITDVDAARSAALMMQGHGYWQPMSHTILWCIEAGIISDEPKWEPEAAPVIIRTAAAKS